MQKTQAEKLREIKNILETKKMSIYRSGEMAVRYLKNSGANEESIENKRKMQRKI